MHFNPGIRRALIRVVVCDEFDVEMKQFHRPVTPDVCRVVQQELVESLCANHEFL